MSGKFLPVLGLVALASGLVLATLVGGLVWLTFASSPAGLNPEAQNWLVTEEELSSFSDEIGIVGWQTAEENPGVYRICRVFYGSSWSINPNFASSCVWDISPGSTFEQVIESMYKAHVLEPIDVALEPRFSYDRDYALYTYQDPRTGQSVYTGLLLGDDIMFVVVVSVGTPGGYSPETVFDEYGDVIEGFLAQILTLNMAKSGQSLVITRPTYESRNCPSATESAGHLFDSGSTILFLSWTVPDTFGDNDNENRVVKR